MKSGTVISVAGLALAGLIPLASSAQTIPQPQHGIIEGILIYPGDVLPAQKVCATHLQTAEVFCIETQQSQERYRLQVPSGAYHVFTQACSTIYPMETTCADGYEAKRAYYNTYVECGLTYHCHRTVTENVPVSIDVIAGAIHTNVNPHDWYTD